VSATLPCISIRQPWAWMIVNSWKDIENREWPTRFRGRILVHAAKGMTHSEWESAWSFAHGSGASPAAIEAGITFDTIERGGIVGSVDLVDCVEKSESRWFVGRYGFVLARQRARPFVPYRGQLGIFAVPADVIASEPVTEQRAV
jgi:hypothetical protein